MDSVGNIIVYFIAAIAIAVFSVLTVTSRRILRSATYLLFVLLSTAVIYFQLGYQFLGAVQIAVYAGGIMVLFVFAIVLTHKPNDRSGVLDTHRRVVGILASGVGTVLLLFALFYMRHSRRVSLKRKRDHHAADRRGLHRFGKTSVSSPLRGYKCAASGMYNRRRDNRP